MEKIIEVWASLYVNDFYKRVKKIKIEKNKNDEVTVDGRKVEEVTAKSYDETCNVLKLREYYSDNEWRIDEKVSGKDPGKIYKQLQPQA